MAMASWNGNRKLVEKLVQLGLDINEVYQVGDRQ